MYTFFRFWLKDLTSASYAVRINWLVSYWHWQSQWWIHVIFHPPIFVFPSTVKATIHLRLKMMNQSRINLSSGVISVLARLMKRPASLHAHTVCCYCWLHSQAVKKNNLWTHSVQGTILTLVFSTFQMHSTSIIFFLLFLHVVAIKNMGQAQLCPTSLTTTP